MANAFFDPGMITGQPESGGILERMLQRKEEAKRIAALGKLSEAFLKNAPEVAKQLGYGDDLSGFQAKSAQDKVTEVMGAIGGMELRRQQAQIAADEANADYLRRFQNQVPEQQRASGMINALRAFNTPVPTSEMSSRFNAMVPGSGKLLIPEYTKRAQIAAGLDAMDGRQMTTDDVVNVMRMREQMAPAEGNQFNWVPPPAGMDGVMGWTTRNTGGTVISPVARINAQADAEIEKLRRKYELLLSHSGLRQATDDSGNPLENVYLDSNNKVINLQTAMQKMGLPGLGQPALAEKPAATLKPRRMKRDPKTGAYIAVE